MAAALSCTECEELLALAAVGALSPDEAAAMQKHVSSCQSCQATSRAFQQTAAVLPDSLDLLAPPAQLRRRLIERVHPVARREKASRLRSLWLRVPQSRLISAAGAAAVAAAVGLAILATRPGAQPAATRTFAVTGAAGEPALHGQLLYLPSSSRSVLSVAGLPAAPSSQVYEVWLIPRSGSARPAAFLAPAPDGSAWTAVVPGDPGDFKQLAATLEPAGGSTQPSGAPLFSVDLSGA